MAHKYQFNQKEYLKFIIKQKKTHHFVLTNLFAYNNDGKIAMMIMMAGEKII
jgi:hypothetical protein